MNVCESAQHLAAYGWPVFPVKAGGKEPITSHGVKDATTNEQTILHWWNKWPDANIGVACGTPGPTVLDIDDLEAGRDVLAKLEDIHAPMVATARGRHVYFQGQEHGTISLGYGELRGRGSYVVAPPSLHPSGKTYVWLATPNGKLPDVPPFVAANRKSAGAGIRPIVERVPHAQRHPHLKDLAVRLVRSGLIDPPAIERALEAEYEAVCDKQPPAKSGEFAELARWAASSDIAQREIERTEAAQTEGPTKSPKANAWPRLPSHDADLIQIRTYLTQAAALPPGWQVDLAERHGPHGADPMTIIIRTPGAPVRVRFDVQRDASKPGALRGALMEATRGACRMPYPKPSQASDFYAMVCALAHVTDTRTVADETRDWVDEYLANADPLHGFTLSPDGRYDALQALRARQAFERAQAQKYLRMDLAPGDRFTALIDSQTGDWWIRAGEFACYLRHILGVGNIAQHTVDARLEEIQIERHRLEVDLRHKGFGHPALVLYRISPQSPSVPQSKEEESDD